MNNKRKRILLSLSGMFLATVMLGTGTYAWFKWRSTAEQNVNVNLTASSTITFIGGTDIVGELEPVLNKEDGTLKKIEITSDTPGNRFSLYMKINSLPDELKNSTFLWAIYKGDEYIDGDSFENYNNNDNIVLLNDVQISSESKDEYNIYYWIDGSVVNNNNMMNKTVNLSLYATGESGAINEIEE